MPFETIGDPKSEASVSWSRNHFRILKEGGIWGVPRSGLMFRKEGGKLICIARMPHIAEMPINAEQLKEQQDSDIEVITESFGLAGIPVEDHSK